MLNIIVVKKTSKSIAREASERATTVQVDSIHAMSHVRRNLSFRLDLASRDVSSPRKIFRAI